MAEYSDELVKICKACRSNNYEKYRYSGYYFFKKVPDSNKCLYCSNELEDTIITQGEMWDISEVSNDLQFLEAMIELKEKDPIEFQLKMQQFRNQTKQREQLKQQERSKPKCPKCKSTSITTGARGANFMFGLIGASKTVNRCANCGYTWKP